MDINYSTSSVNSLMVIKPLNYQSNPCKFFQSLLQQRWPVLLDSCQSGRFDIISANPKQCYLVKDAKKAADTFSQIQQALGAMQTHHGEWPFIGGALGYFGYDLGLGLEAIAPSIVDDIHLPLLAVGIYDWAIVTDHLRAQSVYINQKVDKPHWHWLCELLNQSPKYSAFIPESHWQASLNQADYFKAFDQIMHHIHQGDCYQINLSQRFLCDYQGHPFGFYQALRKRNGAPFSAYLAYEFAHVLSCSPERLLQIKQGQVQAKPIKGTAARHLDPAIDQQRAHDLKTSIKDRAENLMIVDLLRNDLNRCCEVGSVHVPKLFALESYASVHHLVSTVEGTLRQDLNAIDVLTSCFPGGSITGAPKIRAMQIIESLEQHRRAIYCGSIGYISFDGTLDMNIAIRSLIAKQKLLYCWGGGGIVADSKRDAEYQETLHKIRPMLELINYLMETHHAP